jgi:hypothetical protein
MVLLFSEVRLLASCPAPNLEDEQLPFMWCLLSPSPAWITIPGTYSPASVALPYHIMVVTEEGESACYLI